MSNPVGVFILSTCGTSLLTHGAPPPLREALVRTANCREEELSPADRQLIDRRLREQTRALEGGSIADARRVSAELNGLLGFYEGQLARAAGDVHVLLHTDTYQGAAAAGALEGWLRGRGVKQAWSHRAEGLSTRGAEAFLQAMSGLVGWCQATLTGYRAGGRRVVFNLVGGFKSVQGFMQALGMFYADEIFYLFESGGELLRIPRLPIDFEAAARGIIGRRLPLFRRLAWERAPLAVGPGGAVPGGSDASASDSSASDSSGSDLSGSDSSASAGSTEWRGLSDVPEALLFRLGGDVELSPWGRLLWERVKGEIYGAELLPAPGGRLRFGPALVREAAKLPPERLRQLNERLDDLARHLEAGGRWNPARLDFKPLKGNPAPPSTHECDAWADGAAWRFFGHFEGDVLVIDHVGPGLH